MESTICTRHSLSPVDTFTRDTTGWVDTDIEIEIITLCVIDTRLIIIYQ